MKKIFSLFVCILCCIFLVCAPGLIVSGVGKNIYTLRAEQEGDPYKGILQMWHIVSFKTPGQSGVSFLQEQITNFEKQNAYVFIELSSLTPQEAQARMQEGEFPDIVSFPLGFFSDSSRFTQLPETDLFLPAYHADSYAYPYMADSYTLLCNELLFSEREVSLPLDGAFSQDHFLYALKELSFEKKEEHIYSLGFSNTSGTASSLCLLYPAYSEEPSDELLEYTPPGDALGSYDLLYEDASSSFLSQACAMYLCPRSEASALAADPKSAALSLTELPVSNFTDLVQYLSIAATGDEKKEAMCLKFVNYLLSEKVQTALTATEMLPTVQIDEPSFDSPDLEDLYLQIGYLGMTPTRLSYAAAINDLPALCKSALLGDASSLAKIHELF